MFGWKFKLGESLICPAVPSQCKDWVEKSSLRNKIDLPELLTEITRQIENPDWCEGSDQPETIPQTERREDHPEVQQAWDRYVEEKWLPWTKEHNVWEKSTRFIPRSLPSIKNNSGLARNTNSFSAWDCLPGKRLLDSASDATWLWLTSILEFEARLGEIYSSAPYRWCQTASRTRYVGHRRATSARGRNGEGLTGRAEDDPWEKRLCEGVLQGLWCIRSILEENMKTLWKRKASEPRRNQSLNMLQP